MKANWQNTAPQTADFINERPMQYILGGTRFCGLWFDVTKDTLIPRPETEELVGLIIERYKDKRINVVDLGTGSGNIAVSLAVNLDAFVYAVDISKEALLVAEKNARRYKVEDKISFIQNDWLFGLKAEPADVIVSNPPYIASFEWDSLPVSVKDYEPKTALYGGDQGLDCYKLILSNAQNYLKPNGEIFFEIGYNQGSLVKELLTEKGCFGKIEVIKDKAGRDRIVSGLAS